MTKSIVTDIEKCMACKGCEMACAVVHSKSKVLEEAMAETPRPQRRVTVEPMEGFAVPIQCRHCEEAPCIAVCPTAAIHRHQVNDPVLIDRELCIGCRFCLAVCPFGAIDISADGKAVVKCDLCVERTKAGQEPACVEACPTGALKLVEDKELTAAKRRRAAGELVWATHKAKEQTKLKENSQ
ncbi:MAG: 4Fe-4S dicluster domain-containing protein [Planctomycetota bacterium]|jgi:carbon-monoxide dehydrogenase iron sulfur subunit